MYLNIIAVLEQTLTFVSTLERGHSISPGGFERTLIQAGNSDAGRNEGRSSNRGKVTGKKLPTRGCC